VNGQKKSESAPVPTFVGSNVLRVGLNPGDGSAGSDFSGLISEVQFFHRALEPLDVDQRTAIMQRRFREL
jgi:hypothetical protein